jgi:hypothetical protein
MLEEEMQYAKPDITDWFLDLNCLSFACLSIMPSSTSSTKLIRLPINDLQQPITTMHRMWSLGVNAQKKKKWGDLFKVERD